MVSAPVLGLWLVENDHVIRILASYWSGSGVITGYWPLIDRELSRDKDTGTGLWLVRSDQVTCITVYCILEYIRSYHMTCILYWPLNSLESSPAQDTGLWLVRVITCPWYWPLIGLITCPGYWPLIGRHVLGSGSFIWVTVIIIKWATHNKSEW